MILDINVNIKLAEIVGKAGTWFPCLCIFNSELTEDKYDEYTKPSDLVDTKSGKTVYGESSDVYAAASKMMMQDNAPNKFAVLALKEFTAATMSVHATKGWRQLVLVGEYTEEAKTVAEYIEGTKNLMLFVGVQEMADLTALYAKVKSYDRTFIVYHTTDEHAVAAVVGAIAGRVAGSFTYKNLKIKGVDAEVLSSTELAAIHKEGGTAIVEKVGDIVTSEGKAASGEYADIVDSMDYVVQNIAYKTQKVFNNNDKVPYTNQGIAMLEAATIEALQDGYNNGMIATKEDGTPDYSVTFALRKDTTETDRASRIYPYGQFHFALAGAIHEAVVSGMVSV